MEIGIIGAFGFEDVKKYCGGQPVKTRELYYLLENEFSKDSISFADTYKWKKNPITFFFKTIKLIKKSNVVIILPAQNGLSILSSLCVKFKRKNTKIFYDVIGGWLPDYLKTNKKVLNNLEKFNCIWIETKTMKDKLLSLGLKNIEIIPNFKNITPLSNSNLTYFSKQNNKFKVCTFSRVSKEKGITDLIRAVNYINSLDFNVELDIYGPIETQYEQEFYNLVSNNSYCKYCGVVDSRDSVEIIKNYYLLCFPTKYYTEGLPGTIIDAYCAGVPVVASNWLSANDIIVDGKTGVLYSFNNYDDLIKKLMFCLNNVDIVNKMKKNALAMAKKYTYQNAKDILVRYFYEK